MHGRTMVVLVAVAGLFTSARPAASQERPGAIYVSGSVTMPWSQGLTADGFQVYTTAPGGFSAGWALGGGVFVIPKASVEFEVSQTGWMERTEPSRYNMTFHEKRRDIFFATAVRLHTRPARAFDIEPVLGFHLVKGEAWRSTDYGSSTGGPTTVGAPWHQDFETVAGFSAGADVCVGGGRVALVGSFRLHRSFRPSTGDYPGGFSNWAFRPGAGVRVTF